MDSQKISQLVENRELYPITDIGGELNFIFKSSLFGVLHILHNLLG